MRVSRAEQVQAIAHDTRREWAAKPRKSLLLRQKILQKSILFCSIFYPSRRLGISSPQAYIITLQRVYHHRRCIPLRLDDIQCLRIDDMPQRVADDIQGLCLDLFTIM